MRELLLLLASLQLWGHIINAYPTANPDHLQRPCVSGLTTSANPLALLLLVFVGCDSCCHTALPFELLLASHRVQMPHRVCHTTALPPAAHRVHYSCRRRSSGMTPVATTSVYAAHSPAPLLMPPGVSRRALFASLLVIQRVYHAAALSPVPLLVPHRVYHATALSPGISPGEPRRVLSCAITGTSPGLSRRRTPP